MSLAAAFKGEGNGFLERNKNRRKVAFLNRNVSKSLLYLTMGSAIPSFRTPSRPRSRDEVITPSDEEGDENPRPAKRWRTSLFEEAASRNEMASASRRLFGQVTEEKTRASRASSKLQPLQPSDFYGNPRPAPIRTDITKRPRRQPRPPRQTIDEILIPPTMTDFKQAIRLDITGIVQQPPKADESVSFMRGRRNLDQMDISCVCSVSLLFSTNDGATQLPQDYEVLFQKNSTCILRSSIDNEGKALREFIDLEPFIIPKVDLFTNSKKRNRQGQFVRSYGFAENYFVSIKIEPIGLQKQWPPFDLSSLTNIGNDSNPIIDLLKLGNVHKNDLELNATMRNLFDPVLQGKAAPLKLLHRSLKQKIPFALASTISWSCPNQYSYLSTNIKIEDKSLDSENARASATTAPAPVSPLGHRGKEVGALDSPTDSREKRQRSKVTSYNLKDLMAVQQGKSPRTRKTKDPEDKPGVVVTYTFGKADAAESFIKQQTTVTGSDCPFCGHVKRDRKGRPIFSLDDLRLHLHMVHTSLKFSLRRSSPQRIGFFVELAKRGLRGSPKSPSQRGRTFQLNPPRTLFNLERFLDGDEDWAKSRAGPQHNLWPEHLQDRAHDSSSSPSLYGSRHSSPNTSNGTDDLIDLENEQSKPPIRPRKRYLVPKTSKPLYDTVTKQVLIPGTEIPDSDDEKDEQWLQQKHRDIVMDYSDVTDDEKDYINKWNPFIMNAQLTSETHLGETILRFVEEFKFWFAQRHSRKREFAKSMETFLMRGVIDTKCFQKCLSILRDAEKMMGSKENEAVEVERPVSPAKQRGGFDCDCEGGHTQPSDRVICHGEKCTGRFFHRKCAEKSGRSIKGRWLCDHCVS